MPESTEKRQDRYHNIFGGIYISRLFVPLNKTWYKLFKEGKKLWEIRAVSQRFNDKTVYLDRLVELRRGYAVKGALWGIIIDIIHVNDIYDLPKEVMQEALPIDKSEVALWNKIDRYNEKYDNFVIFKVHIPRHPDMSALSRDEAHVLLVSKSLRHYENPNP